MRALLALLRQSRGAIAIEYGLIAALVAVAAIAVLQGRGEGHGATSASVAAAAAR